LQFVRLGWGLGRQPLPAVWQVTPADVFGYFIAVAILVYCWKSW
jgi:hypothetical protein